MATNNNLKAWVRYDGQNKIVPSSLILQAKKPKVGTWVEIPTDLCCTTTTTTAYCLQCTRWKYIGTDPNITIQGTPCGGTPDCVDQDFAPGDEKCLQFVCGGNPTGPDWVNLGPCTP